MIRFIDAANDAWHPISDDLPIDDLQPQPYLLLTECQWHAVRDRWPGDVAMGLLVGNDTDIETLAAELPGIALVVLQFPKWVDGRAYSQARVLRVRLRYAGAVRASGAVLVDMLPLLVRTGFDEVVLRADQSQEAAEHALTFFAGGHYQGDTIETQPPFARSASA